MLKLWRIFLLLIIFMTVAQDVSVAADDDEFSLGEALAKLGRKKDLPMSVEVRFDEPEFIFRYEKFSVNYSNFGAGQDLHYVRLSVDNEIISLLGTGLDWSCGITGIAWKNSVDGELGGHNFTPLPTLGMNLHVAVMPKMKIYVQLSGMTLGGRAHIFDNDFGVRYSPSKNFTLTAGFRHIAAKVRHKSNRCDFHTSAPFIGVRSDF